MTKRFGMSDKTYHYQPTKLKTPYVSFRQSKTYHRIRHHGVCFGAHSWERPYRDWWLMTGCGIDGGPDYDNFCYPRDRLARTRYYKAPPEGYEPCLKCFGNRYYFLDSPISSKE